MSLEVSVKTDDKQVMFDIDRRLWYFTSMPTGVYIYNRYVDANTVKEGKGTLQAFIRDATALWTTSQDTWVTNDTSRELRRMAVSRLLKCLGIELESRQIDLSSHTVSLIYQLLLSVCTQVLIGGNGEESPIRVGTVHNAGDVLQKDAHTGRVAINDGSVLRIEWYAHVGGFTDDWSRESREATFDFLMFSTINKSSVVRR